MSNPCRKRKPAFSLDPVRRERALRAALAAYQANELTEAATTSEDEFVCDSPELIDARQKRDTWQVHANSSSSTSYAREQAAIWTRRVAEIEQEMRPIDAQNIIRGPFANADEIVAELRTIREQVGHSKKQMEML